MDKEFCNNYVSSEFFDKLCPKDFGKMMGIIVENRYIKELIESNTIVKLSINIDEQDGNATGFDLKTTNGLRIQIKFRQVDGITLTSKQVDISNTRRKSKKNMGYASKSGHVAYKSNEFDCILVVLCPHSKKYGVEKRDPKYWQIVCIDVKNIIDPDNIDYCLTKVTPVVLQKGVDWKKILERLDGEK